MASSHADRLVVRGKDNEGRLSGQATIDRDDWVATDRDGRMLAAHRHFEVDFERQRTLPGRSMAILSAWVGHAGAALATV